jgi:hypothetical protein
MKRFANPPVIARLIAIGAIAAIAGLVAPISSTIANAASPNMPCSTTYASPDGGCTWP